MHICQGGTDGNHVQMWIFLKKGTAFQAAVNRFDHHILTGDLLIDLTGQRDQPAARIDSPCGRVVTLDVGEAKRFSDQPGGPQDLFRPVIHTTALHRLQDDLILFQ